MRRYRLLKEAAQAFTAYAAVHGGPIHLALIDVLAQSLSLKGEPLAQLERALRALSDIDDVGELAFHTLADIEVLLNTAEAELRLDAAQIYEEFSSLLHIGSADPLYESIRLHVTARGEAGWHYTGSPPYGALEFTLDDVRGREGSDIQERIVWFLQRPD